jgi:hypothetical protein
MASVIVDIIHDTVATKADISELRGEIHQADTGLRGDIHQVDTGLRGEIRQVETSLRGEIRQVETSLRGEMALIEHRLLTRLGGLAVVLAGMLFAALHYWPPH